MGRATYMASSQPTEISDLPTPAYDECLDHTRSYIGEVRQIAVARGKFGWSEHMCQELTYVSH